MENNYILAINPGSTSTKVAVSIGTEQVFLRSIQHNAEELDKFILDHSAMASWDDGHLPTLEKAKGKIVWLSRNPLSKR